MDYSPGSLLRGILNKEFQEENNNWFREWYFNKYSHEELMKFKNKYYEDLEKNQKLTYFVKWFLNYHLEEISNKISVIQKTWNKYSHEELMKFKNKYYEDLEKNQKL